jgi:putative SOS response-associated peptidase YedK
MCNDYEQHVSWATYHEAMQQLELGVPTEQDSADLPRADDIRVNERGPMMRVAGNGVELVPMTFGFPPSRPAEPPSSTLSRRGGGSTRATAA